MALLPWTATRPGKQPDFVEKNSYFPRVLSKRGPPVRPHSPLSQTPASFFRGMWSLSRARKKLSGGHVSGWPCLPYQPPCKLLSQCGLPQMKCHSRKVQQKFHRSLVPILFIPEGISNNCPAFHDLAVECETVHKEWQHRVLNGHPAFTPTM